MLTLPFAKVRYHRRAYRKCALECVSFYNCYIYNIRRILFDLFPITDPFGFSRPRRSHDSTRYFFLYKLCHFVFRTHISFYTLPDTYFEARLEFKIIVTSKKKFLCSFNAGRLPVIMVRWCSFESTNLNTE